jgi:N6-adenosine-specific RNA methylase IME4
MKENLMTQSSSEVAETPVPRDEDDFTRIAGKLLVGVRDLVNWGLDTGNTTPEKMRESVVDRRAALPKLIEAGVSQRQCARMFSCSHKMIQKDLVALGMATESPESGDPVATREATVRESNARLRVVAPEPVITRYGTIVIDPPWDVEKIKRDVRPNQVPPLDYPTMSEDELKAFPVAEMAEDDCHLFCWTTHKHLPSALRLIETFWEFKYTLLMTWHKPGGFQPHGLPQYNSEFVVYARRGNPKFRDTQAFNTCFQAERRQHSRKPDAFYDTVRRVTADGRIDVFSREPRDGFDQYGNEIERFAHG